MNDLQSEHAGAADAEEESWFEKWFASPYYIKLYSHRDHSEAAACADLIVQATGVEPATGDGQGGRGVDVLDLASGPGRHAIAFAERGFNVTAVDLSPTLLEFARREAEEAGVGIELVRCDMREIPFVDRFDLAVQLFTSFGYFATEEEDARVLMRVRRALHDGAWYALDLINERHLRRTLVPRSTKTIDEIEVVEERRIEGDHVVKQIAITAGDDRMRYEESVRLYAPERIETMLRAAGLTPVRWFGGYHGESYDRETSERMLVICRALPPA